MDSEDYATPGKLALLTDLYELTMCAAYFKEGRNQTAAFELFVRSAPPNRPYLVFAGLDQILRYLKGLRFTSEQIAYLSSLNMFDREFLHFLSRLRFTGEVHAMQEGAIFFPGEPVLRITAPRIEAQLVETFLLNAMNFQTLAATKASRIMHAARGKSVIDFSPRRAHGPDAAMKSARSSHIAGFSGTSNVLAGMAYGIPVYGTIAHSFIMAHRSELDAFRAYARAFPKNAVFLIDTYDTLQGAKNAVIVGTEMRAQGHELAGVRLDSGNLLALSKQVRKILDAGGFPNAKIFASGDLDEYKIDALVRTGKAPIDSFGVGTALGTSNDAPSLNVNYKLCEVEEENGEMRPVMKLSAGKRSLPGRKQVYRHVAKDGRFLHDVIALDGELYEGQPLLLKWMENGRVAKQVPALDALREHCRGQLAMLPEKFKVLRGSPKYSVKLSPKLSALVKKIEKEI
jgi:nicotinate phosphoribosyltransferase